MSSAKRSLFQTPTRSTKRRRTTPTTKRSAPMRIPRALMPEVKQYSATALTTAGANQARHNILTNMTQGTGSDQYLGSRIRMKRLRVHYDYSDLSLTHGVRLLVVIPKQTTFGLPANQLSPIDTNEFTVLYDLLLPNDPSVLAGTFDVVGPINMEWDNANNVKKNGIHVIATSVGAGSGLASRTSLSMWFTDA